MTPYVIEMAILYFCINAEYAFPLIHHSDVNDFIQEWITGRDPAYIYLRHESSALNIFMFLSQYGVQLQYYPLLKAYLCKRIVTAAWY